MFYWRKVSSPSRDAALLAEMLSLPNDKRHPPIELTAQQRRQKTLEALTTQLGQQSALGKC